MSRPVALVTGGGRGIGAAISDRLARDGYDVLLTYNQSSKPAEMVVDSIRDRGDDALAVKVDCSDSGEVGLLGQHPWMERGVEVLVLNHGIYNRVQGHAMTMDDLTSTMKTNFEGAVAVWKAVQPHLADHARMVVVGSQLGTRFPTRCRLRCVKGSPCHVGPFAGSIRGARREARQHPRSRLRRY